MTTSNKLVAEPSNYNIHIPAYNYMHVYFITVGVDYHFHDEALFVALTSGLIERYNISVMSTDSGVLESLQSSNPVEVYSAPSGNTLGDITVDWLHNTIYWIESTDSGVQVRMSIHPSVCPSNYSLSIHSSIHPSIHPFIHPCNNPKKNRSNRQK